MVTKDPGDTVDKGKDSHIVWRGREYVPKLTPLIDVEAVLEKKGIEKEEKEKEKSIIEPCQNDI